MFWIHGFHTLDTSVPPSGYAGFTQWIRRFHPVDTLVSPNGYDGSTQWIRRFQGKELSWNRYPAYIGRCALARHHLALLLPGPNPLPRAARSVVVRQAGSILTSLLVREAKICLRNSSLSVQQVAEMLGFRDQSLSGSSSSGSAGCRRRSTERIPPPPDTNASSHQLQAKASRQPGSGMPTETCPAASAHNG